VSAKDRSEAIIQDRYHITNLLGKVGLIAGINLGFYPADTYYSQVWQHSSQQDRKIDKTNVETLCIDLFGRIDWSTNK
jgi:hypothetical protein